MALEPAPLLVDGVEFVHAWSGTSTPERFVLVKPGALREAHLGLLAAHEGARILELGIYLGGSTALAALVAHPSKLVAVDIGAPVEALTAFLSARGLEEVVRCHYRTDQADRAALEAIVRGDFGTEPIDLVLDDASHLLPESVASFEATFPFLRPGGRYAIEDWRTGPRAAHGMALLLGDEGAFEAAMEDPTGHWLLRTAAAPDGMLHASASTVLDRALKGGGPEADRARRVVEAFDWDLTAPRPRPLSAFVRDLAAVAASQPHVISRLEVDQHWITVERGPADLPRSGWRLLAHADEGEELLGTWPER